MHTVVIRRDVYERDPWVAMSLYKALCRAKDYALHLVSETGSPKASFAWLQPLDRGGAGDHRQGLVSLRHRGEPRRRSRRCCNTSHEHGLTPRRLKIEELFAPSTLRDIPLSEGQQV